MEGPGFDQDPSVTLAVAAIVLSLGVPWLYTLLSTRYWPPINQDFSTNLSKTGPMGLTSGVGAFYVLPVFLVSIIAYLAAVIAAKTERS